MKFSSRFLILSASVAAGVTWLVLFAFSNYQGNRPAAAIGHALPLRRSDVTDKVSRTNSKVLTMAARGTVDNYEIAVGKLVQLLKTHQILSPLEIKGLFSSIDGPKPKELSDEQWEERINIVLNLLRRQEVQTAKQDSASSGSSSEVGSGSAVPGLTEYLLKAAETCSSKVLRLYAMQHMCLWYSEEGDLAKRRAIIQLLSKLASRPGDETAGCAVMMLADLRRNVGCSKTASATKEARQVDSDAAEVGIDWGAVDDLLARDIGRLIGDNKGKQDVRISAIHACVDLKDATPLPEIRAIAADETLVSTLRKVAIHAIGQLGTSEDSELLNQIRINYPDLRPATEPAIKTLAAKSD